MVEIEGCTAIVTGGNRGIGLGFVRTLLNEGARKIYIGSRDPADGETIAAEAPDRLSAVKLDVTNAEDVAAAADACGDVDLVVNNAGVFGHQTLIGAPDMSSVRQEMEVNFFGLLAMCRAFAPVLKANEGGAIINVLSAGGIVAVPDMGGYSPSKFAARAASNCIRAELAPQGTQVTALIVGSVDTRMAAHVKGIKKSQPEDIAASALAAVRRGVEEHDTDVHAMSVRAWLARDPSGLAASMAARMAKAD
ncbi:MAG: SDR family oxidoreductase [Pseudomonadota bacterium]